MRHAATVAARAPSILNTQPWRWRVDENLLELRADRSRQVSSIDPRGRLLTLSCGAALHHARLVLAVTGREPVVTRLPDLRDPDLLARIRLGGLGEASWDDTYMRRAIPHRRTDRRPFPSIGPVPQEATEALRRVAEAEQIRLHRIPGDRVAGLRAAVELAQRAQSRDHRYLRELLDWVRRPRGVGEGVPPDTFVPAVARPVPLRDFAQAGEVRLHPGAGDDLTAEYLVLVTDGDDRIDWLRAGEAASAVWLTAAHHELAVSVLSDVIEVPEARQLLRTQLPGAGHPQLVLRVGVDLQPTPPKASPRRPPSDFIEPT